MYIIFLDIDGVLCTDRSFARKDKEPFPLGFHIPFRTGWDRLDEECIGYLNRITEATGAKIVISSTWRQACSTEEEFGYLIDYLKREGVKARIIDKTPVHHTYFGARGKDGRGAEIKEWLQKTKEQVEGIVILDDDTDMNELVPWLVHTSEPIGLQDWDVQPAIDLLNSPMPTFEKGETWDFRK